MTLGQRIKEARLEKQMTQQELVGEFITRNMLSKIENDSATPSVRTLEYLADRLGLSPGEFLSDSIQADSEGLDALEKLLEEDPKEFTRRLPEEKRRVRESEQRLRLLEAESCLLRGELAQAQELLELDEPEAPSLRFRHLMLRGSHALASGNLEKSRLLLSQAERVAPPRADMAKLYRQLEKCCQLLGDYENAYLYATLQRGA